MTASTSRPHRHLAHLASALALAAIALLPGAATAAVEDSGAPAAPREAAAEQRTVEQAPADQTATAPAATVKPAAAPPAAEQAATAAAKAQFLAVLRPVARLQVESAWTAAEQQAVGRHFQRLQEAAAAGTVILAGRTQEPLDRTFGLIVFEAADEAAARAWAEADPAVAAGVMTVTVHPYAVAVARP